jgi:CubicO group peptidase (beta-lactamase class C family)
VRQVMDMVTNLEYSENYADPKAEIWEHSRAGSLLPKPTDYTGAPSFYDYLPLVKLGTEYKGQDGAGQHGMGFRYKTVNTDVLGWIIRRLSGERLGEQISKHIWQRLGCEQDAYITVDTAGTEFAGGGLHTTLRDLARFGEMMRCMGSFNGQQIVPEAVVAGIARGGDPAHFATAGYHTLPGWSYQSMWWHSHNAHGAYMARGIHGQAIYIDPKADMVIARYGSHPMAGNIHLDPTSIPAYHAIAKHLVDNPSL